jgi:hypothetical protein
MKGLVLTTTLLLSAQAYYVELSQAPASAFTQDLNADVVPFPKVAVLATTSGALLSSLNAHTVGSSAAEREATLTLQVNGRADESTKENRYHSFGVVEGDFWAPCALTQFREVVDAGRYEVSLTGNVKDTRKGHEKDKWPVAGIG